MSDLMLRSTNDRKDQDPDDSSYPLKDTIRTSNGPLLGTPWLLLIQSGVGMEVLSPLAAHSVLNKKPLK